MTDAAAAAATEHEIRYPSFEPPDVFRFKAGDTVFVRDLNTSGRGYRIVSATVRAQHYHPDRHPGYPNGEGYTLDGELWWDCYPGCRVFATRAEALAARIAEVA